MNPVLTLALPAELTSLPEFLRAVMGAAEASGVPSKTLFEIELVVEEAVVNIISYAYEGGKGDIQVVCRGGGGTPFLVEITDRGRDFDMTRIAAPDISSAIEDRQTGGLGIYFIKKLADRVAYRRENGKNILVITFG
jgi:serine/threonine-protein kinase RsbW